MILFIRSKCSDDSSDKIDVNFELKKIFFLLIRNKKVFKFSVWTERTVLN